MPLYPFLISFYAVLALLSENISEVSVNVIWRLLLVLNLCVLILLVLLYILTRDWRKSGLILSFLLLLFFSYGHIYNFLRDTTVGGIYVFSHPFLIIEWLVLGVFGIIVIYHIKNPLPLVQFANALSIIMLLFPIYNIGLYLVRESAYNATAEPQTTSLHLPAGQPAPDVYFIVMDAYGRADVLQRVFSLDNSGFIKELQDMGFYVVQCSQSNYARTRLSIASTLNMDYIQSLNPNLRESEVNLRVQPYILHSQVRTLFEGLKYKTVGFYNGYQWLHWQNADYFLREGEKTSILLQLATTITPFEELFLKTTFVRGILDLRLAGADVSADLSHRQTVTYMLETLPKVPEISGPKFIYAHFILPHPPFIFGPNGEKVNIGSEAADAMNDVDFYQDEAMRAGYHDQVLYTNRLMIPILRSLIEKSSVPPIIVLESDHGPTGYEGAHNRMQNFMAYYFPGKDAAHLAYPSITPVNSFRLVFNTYFGGDYPLLKDVSYYSPATSDLDYEVIPNTCAQQ